ncbi:type III restriction/modification system, res subunit [Campylobacter mucosalis CCUG 21559]|uniref:Type III restriction/modification system, res subunit n=1 Tax=Campylobacter mucosalis CCUG 21559 TaxID=1032067 RepID=A0A6G5QFF7_9BACT|nr:type III restriction/modification system, res subunit [Campylobacter mucosalis CCUG 21559]
MPQAISDFVNKQNEPNREIEILIINAGMINSQTLSTTYHKRLFDMFDSPFEALANIKPILIIDEPHRFKQSNKTFENINKINAQYIFRFGATFDNEERNLIYKLTSAQAFNDNLVKGVKIFINDFSSNEQENVALKLKDLNANEATFELNENGKKREFKIAKNEAMGKIHKDLSDLYLQNLNAKVAVLSNGLELSKNSVINPYSYNQTLNQKMINEAINEHFKLEEQLFKREDKIKPLTLFFIDNIDEYRGENGALRLYFEQILKAKMSEILKNEREKSDKNEPYIEYLEKSLKDISLTHGGYFSKDNSESDEKIEKEINEILHDKEWLLSAKNPRRFIFSKWTLREGWDNPNVFGICKLRSSGSVTSKLQEVGRGLRLPVNEYGSRIKDGEFYLNYFVDFTERDFASSLISEINLKSEVAIFSENDEKISDELVKRICEIYEKDYDDLIDDLAEKNIILASRKFKELYPLAFISNGVKRDKIINSNDKRQTAHIRVAKFDELKELWERINQKAILQYNIQSEDEFLELFGSFLSQNITNFKPNLIVAKEQTIKIKDSVAYFETTQKLQDEILPISYMTYGEFLIKLSSELKAKISTIHNAFGKNPDLDINKFLNNQTIRFIKNGFSKFILDNSINKFSVEYKKITNKININPTAFTDRIGNPKSEIEAGNLGVCKDDEQAVSSYLFDEIYYDSELEKDNILSNIESISVFTKIPKNSIKIPVSGGGSYSPDFAYVIKDRAANRTLHLIVEVKNKEERDLSSDEKQKIEHAKKFFKTISESVKIEFKTQLQGQRIRDLIAKMV